MKTTKSKAPVMIPVENELSPLPVTDDGVSFTVPAHGFTTVKLEI